MQIEKKERIYEKLLLKEKNHVEELKNVYLSE